MPYAEDLDKRARYIGFIQLRAGLSEELPKRAPGISVQDWSKELQEFAHAAEVFKPMSGVMASRFTSAKSHIEGGTSTEADLLKIPQSKPTDPAVEAARMGMYGPLTREKFYFEVPALVSKRFGIPHPPARSKNDYGPRKDVFSGATGASSSRNGAMDWMSSLPPETLDSVRDESTASNAQNAVVDPETNEALLGERPSDDIFRAIFGDDDDDEADD